MAELIKILKALSDETRYRLVKILLKYDLCVGALAARLNISESAVSQHLKVLRSAGIVKGDKRGYFTHYYVDHKVLKESADKIVQLSRIGPVERSCHQSMSEEDNLYCSRKEGNIDE